MFPGLHCILQFLQFWTAVKQFLQVDNPTKPHILKLLGWSSPLSMCVHCWVAVLILSSCQTLFLHDTVWQCQLTTGLGFAGLVRGVGWQKWGVYANLGTHYGIGLPIAIILALVFHFDGRVICEEHCITFLWVSLLVDLFLISDLQAKKIWVNVVAGDLDRDVIWCGSTDNSPHHYQPLYQLGKLGTISFSPSL